MSGLCARAARALLVQASQLLPELWRAGRRTAEHAATFVDDLLPQVPVRQWVLTLPYRLRYRLAQDRSSAWVASIP